MNSVYPRNILLGAGILTSFLFGAIIPSGFAQGSSPRTLPLESRSRPGIERLSRESASVAIRRKIDRIIFPSVEFRSTTLSDALEFLRQESRRFDVDPDVNARGVNIVVKLPAAGAATLSPRVAEATSSANRETVTTSPLIDPPPPSTNPRITLMMTRIPLLEALKYVAIQAGLKVKIEPYAISLVPLTEDHDQLITATFRVAPGFFDDTIDGGRKTARDQRSVARE